VLSRPEFQTGPKQLRISAQRVVDAYNEERTAMEEEDGEDDAPEVSGPAPN